MIRVALTAALVLAASLTTAARQGDPDLEKLFARAEHKATVDGDLKGAIEQYRRIVDHRGSSRALAARALLRMAEAYQKLGDVQSTARFERLAREFADQSEVAAEARRRLTSLRSAPAPGGLATRQVWTGPEVDILGTVSADGRYLSFSNWETRDLGLRDLVSGRTRLLTRNEPTIGPYADRSAISRDGRQVAYAWFTGRIYYELRVVGVDAGADVPPRRLYSNPDVIYLTPYDWSPDGQTIAVQIVRADRSVQIGLISAKDGSLRTLKSIDWRGVTRMFFSPDGRHLAYDLNVSDASAQRDVFILAIDGSREQPAVVHPATEIVVGWSPDGRRLLFLSDRTGAIGLWSVSVSNGRVEGGPELLKPEIGRGWSLGVSASGALYFGSIVGGPEVEIARVDLQTGQLIGTPDRPVSSFVGTNSAPSWSPDGKFLAYLSVRGFGPVAPQPAVIGIRSVDSGQVREVRSPVIPGTTPLRWSPDGRAFAITGTDFTGRQGIFRIDAQSGEASPLAIAAANEMVAAPHWSPDGTKIYFQRGGNPVVEPVIVERNLASGIERVLIRRRPLGSPVVSPDGRWIVTNTLDDSRKFATLLLISTANGEPREVFRVPLPERTPVSTWAPDSSVVLVRKEKPGGDRAGDEYWQIPIPVGDPRRLGLDLRIGNVPWLSVHPDGRQVAYTSGQSEAEVWALENLFTAPRPRN